MQLMPPPTSHAPRQRAVALFLDLSSWIDDNTTRCCRKMLEVLAPPTAQWWHPTHSRAWGSICPPAMSTNDWYCTTKKAKAWASIRGLQLHGVLKHSELKKSITPGTSYYSATCILSNTKHMSTVCIWACHEVFCLERFCNATAVLAMFTVVCKWPCCMSYSASEQPLGRVNARTIPFLLLTAFPFPLPSPRIRTGFQ